MNFATDTAARTKGGWTPLHWASERGYTELTRLLIEHGTDMAARTKHRLTPLYWASEGGHMEVAQWPRG